MPPYSMDATVVATAERQWSERFDHVFLEILNERAESYDDFFSRSAALAHYFVEIGLDAGAVIGTFVPSGAAALHAWMGTLTAGCVELPLHPALSGSPLRHLIETAQPSAMIVHQQCMPALAALGALPSVRALVIVGKVDVSTFPWAETISHYEDIVAQPAKAFPNRHSQPCDIGTVLFTSGTSGLSKGALLPHGQLAMVGSQVVEAVRLTDADRFYCVHPLNHVAGKYMGVYASMMAGGSVYLEPRFNASIWLDRVRDNGITVSMAHGPMIEMLHGTPKRGDDRDHLMRRMMCCPLPKQIGTDFEARFGLRGVEMWGMTEIGNPLWTALEGQRLPGSCGRVLDEWYEVAIADPETGALMPDGEMGEIVVRPRRPHTSMVEYLGRPDATALAWRDGWFHSGDAAYRDTSGWFFYIDRLDDRIRRRSENISSLDIEMHANGFPCVIESAAVGVSSSFAFDHDIKLFIVAAGQIDIEALFVHLAAELPHYMLPRYVELIAELPRTPTSKIRKKDLRKRSHGSAMWDRAEKGPAMARLYALAPSEDVSPSA